MTLDAAIADAVRTAVRDELSKWEAAQPRPRMIPLKEAAELLGISDYSLRELAPRLPLIIDKAGHRHSVSSVHVYRIIEAGGIEACLDTSLAPSLSGDRGGASEAPESEATSKAAPARKAPGFQVDRASGADRKSA